MRDLVGKPHSLMTYSYLVRESLRQRCSRNVRFWRKADI
jgi:hypothetical protein